MKPKYDLRNQNKISNHYDNDILNRMLESLNKYFNSRIDENGINLHYIDNDSYPVIFVSDCGHSVNDFVFYVLRYYNNTFYLAFKEIIG